MVVALVGGRLIHTYKQRSTTQVSIFTSKKTAPSGPQFPYVSDDSLDARAAGASALAAYATDKFLRCASDLDEAATRLEEVAAEAGAEILVLQDLAGNALEECDDARIAAKKIRGIFA